MIQTIKATYPFVIITDAHCYLSNVRQIKALHGNQQIFCLGDITNLFTKPGAEKYNHFILDYFIENKIPCLVGNHEQYILQCEKGDSFRKTLLRFDEHGGMDVVDYALTQQHLDYLKTLPIGFRLVLPDGNNYFCFHNEPNNLWNFPDVINETYLKQNYFFDERTIGIIQGHLHLNKIDDFNPKRIIVGQLSKGNYALVTETGVEFKRL